MITYFFRTIKDTTIKELPETRSGVWVHVVDPTVEEMEKIIKEFKLDEDIINDALDIYEVPRLEKYENLIYYFTRYPYTDKTGNVTAPIMIVIGENFVLTISVYEVPQFKRFFSGEKPLVTTQKTKFFIEIMNVFTSSFERELRRFQKAVNKDRVRLRSIEPRDIERLVGYETKLNGMVDALVPTNAWIQKITIQKGAYLRLYEEDLDMIQDLVIANNQVVNSARSVLTTIQNIRGATEAIMSSRLNNVLQFLTVLTILLTIPLVIASVYGMNIDLPFQDNPKAFFGIMLVNFVILIVLLLVFRRKNWL